MRLLIVDDSKAMRGMLAAYARELGCETADAADGKLALARLEDAGPFDCVLLDWDMPVMDGLACLKEIRAHGAYDHTKVMMVTSQSSFDRVSEALAAGADDYLMKPMDEAMLADKLRLLGLLV